MCIVRVCVCVGGGFAQQVVEYVNCQEKKNTRAKRCLRWKWPNSILEEEVKFRTHSQWQVAIKLRQTMFQRTCRKWHWVVGSDSCVTRKRRLVSARDDSSTTHLGPKQLTHLDLTGSTPLNKNLSLFLFFKYCQQGAQESNLPRLLGENT